MKTFPCPGCGRQPSFMATRGLVVVGCMTKGCPSRVDSQPGGARMDAKKRWNNAVASWLKAHPDVRPVVEVEPDVDERPDRREPEISTKGLSEALEAYAGKLGRMHQRREQIERDLRPRLIGLPVRYLGRTCYVTNVAVFDGKIHVELWAAHRNNPKRRYRGEDIYCRYIPLSRCDRIYGDAK